MLRPSHSWRRDLSRDDKDVSKDESPCAELVRNTPADYSKTFSYVLNLPPDMKTLLRWQYMRRLRFTSRSDIISPTGSHGPPIEGCGASQRYAQEVRLRCMVQMYEGGMVSKFNSGGQNLL